MTQWYVQDLSKLTQVSVRTLHYYDKIGLLKPSLRHANGYREYSEEDLLKLQQILALKFFGFKLNQIKALLSSEVNMQEHFALQAKLLEEKAQALLQAKQALTVIMADEQANKSPSWQTIINLIEEYRKMPELEKTWAKKIFNVEELKEYAQFEQGLQKRSHEKEAFSQAWQNLVKQMQAQLNTDPKSATGFAIAQQCMAMLQQLYGDKYAHLRTKIWKGFKQGHINNEHGLTPEIIVWLDKAMSHYWHETIYALLAKVGQEKPAVLLQQWQAILLQMYGEDEASKQELYQLALQDEHISAEAKAWLKTIMA